MVVIQKKYGLAGATGFVGSTLSKQTIVDAQFNSETIIECDSFNYFLFTCAAAPAQKWIANSDPEADRQKIEGLIELLGTVQCNTFILVSTVDVFKNSVGANEDTLVDVDGLHPYGRHRRLLEEFVEEHFPNHLIVRLPGLVGPGLRKNVIFDFLNNNNLHAIDSRGVFQFYPMVNLWPDIQVALQAGLKLVHLTAEPISVADIAESCFGIKFQQALASPPAVYDFQSKYASLFGGNGCYQYSRRESIQAIRAYAQSEPVTLKTERGTS